MADPPSQGERTGIRQSFPIASIENLYSGNGLGELRILCTLVQSVPFLIEASLPGRGSLILTGQLGEVMGESVQAALTLVKSCAAQLGVDPAIFEKSDIHVHVLAGATPKDGPSAGVAMFTALTSLRTDRTCQKRHGYGCPRIAPCYGVSRTPLRLFDCSCFSLGGSSRPSRIRLAFRRSAESKPSVNCA
jgi:hypothetical protein